MLSAMQLVAGISWHPEIRGALVVLVASTVLMGSIWLILGTNLGNRLGSLSALAGFFGWMAIMGLIWWIYGIGLKGDDPQWEPKEISYDLSQAITGDVADLASATGVPAPGLIEQYCPGLADATAQTQRQRIVEENNDIPLSNLYSPPADRLYCGEEVGELLAVDSETIAEDLTARNTQYVENDPSDPRALSPAALDAAIATAIDDQERKLNQLTLSGLDAVAPELIEQAVDDGILGFAGWNLFSNAEAGEAQASADAFLTSDADSPFKTSSEFFLLNTFQEGGKPKRVSDGVWDRVRNEVQNTVKFWHPTNTIVVQVVGTLKKETVAGEAPPFPEINPDAQVLSVVMVRNLGDKRLPAALITLSSFAIFLVLVWMLHTRDLELRRRLEDWDPAAAV